MGQKSRWSSFLGPLNFAFVCVSVILGTHISWIASSNLWRAPPMAAWVSQVPPSQSCPPPPPHTHANDITSHPTPRPAVTQIRLSPIGSSRPRALPPPHDTSLGLGFSVGWEE